MRWEYKLGRHSGNDTLIGTTSIEASDSKMDAISEATAQLTNDQRLGVIGKTTEQAAITKSADDQRLGDLQSGA